MKIPQTITYLSIPLLACGALYLTIPKMSAQVDYATPYTFSTIAGTSSFGGSSDGSGNTARFSRPNSLVVDGNGNIYVADTPNGTIRKITSGGVVTTLAGSALNLGSADGTGAAAQFNQPWGITIDNNGNLFVADRVNCTIRKITPTGVVTTFAGSAGLQGTADGVGNSARFYEPTGVVADADNNLFVTDTTNCTIRKITPAGLVTTLAGLAGNSGIGDGSGTLARFGYPTGIAIDGSGNLFVTDSPSDTIRKVTASGIVTTLAGTAGVAGSADGTGSAARFNYPNGVAVDSSGNVYVADSNSSTIRKITSSGAVTTLLGTYGILGSADGTGNAAQFNQPYGIAVDANGNLFIADSSNNTIRKAASNNSVTTLAGSPPGTGSQNGPVSSARFASPYGVVVDNSGNLFVSDSGSNTIRKIAGGIVTTLAGTVGTVGNLDGTGTSAMFSSPTGIAIDGNGNLIVADTGNNTIRKVTPSGVVSTLAGTAGTSGSQDGTGSAAQFKAPKGVAIGGNGYIYVADSGNDTIREITPAGVVSTIAGQAPPQGVSYPIGLGPVSVDGTGPAAVFVTPTGIVADSGGNLYVADSESDTIRKVAPGGVVTTIAGAPGLGYFTAGGDVDSTSADSARFKTPTGIAMDGSGNLFVADAGNNSIRMISESGAVTTLAGNAKNNSGSEAVDGTGIYAQFFTPTGLAVAANGNLYVADSGNQEIRLGVETSAEPIVTIGIQGGTVTTGSSPTLGVTASGTGLTYQWQFNGVNIAGAMASTLQLTNFGTNLDGIYSVTVTNPSGGSTTTSATLNAVSVSKPINVSTRGLVGTGGNILIAGFIVSGTTSETLLVRAVGPGLTTFGVSGVLTDPQIAVFNSSGVQIASNTSWGGSSALSGIFSRTGAFALPANSRDSALVITLAPGAYTAQVSGVSGDSGIALVEVYDVP